MSEPESQTRRPPAERQKSPDSSRCNYTPEFWDKLSRVPLCRSALRELNRRAVQEIVPQLRAKRDVGDSKIKQLQRFARHGGPDLRTIRGYQEQESPDTMSSRHNRHSRSSALTLKKKHTAITTQDPAFEQALIDNGIYPNNRGQKPDNWEEIQKRLALPRPSLSSSQLSNEAFEEFEFQNEEASNEAGVMSQVFPMIAGKTKIPSGFNQSFNNLMPLVDDISHAQPDYFNGSRPAEILPKVREDLEKYIVPSHHRNRPALPNFFMEVKGSDGKPSVVRRQIMQDLAIGARGMLQMQSYGLEEPAYDNKAHTFGATYHDGHMQLYAMYPTKPGSSDGKPEYHTNRIKGFALTSSLESYREGIRAFHNLRDLAEEKRAEFIASANKMVNNEDDREVASVDTSAQSELSHSTAEVDHDESASADKPAKRSLPTTSTNARQLGNKKRKIGDIIVEDDDE